jgi:Protein of unknown function (DUF3140)
MTDEDKKAVSEFKKSVNMSPKQIEKWLDSDESKKVGFKENDHSESVGHKSGKRIIEILNKKQSDYTEDDLKHIHKVVGYIKRHSAQKPDGDITDTNWRYSLMNWGHDPKEQGGN